MHLTSGFQIYNNPSRKTREGFHLATVIRIKSDVTITIGTPEGTRTPDLLIRSQSLYPTELPAHNAFHKRLNILAQHKGKSKSFFYHPDYFLQIVGLLTESPGLM